MSACRRHCCARIAPHRRTANGRRGIRNRTRAGVVVPRMQIAGHELLRVSTLPARVRKSAVRAGLNLTNGHLDCAPENRLCARELALQPSVRAAPDRVAQAVDDVMLEFAHDVEGPTRLVS